MLAIRMKRTGRRGHAQYRVVVQDSRFSPSSGRVVAFIGSYNPHTKTAALDKQKATGYLDNGAQPSDRVAKLFEKEGIKLPKWATTGTTKQKSIKSPDKLRRNRPAEAKAEPETAADESNSEAQEQPAEQPAENVDEISAAEGEAAAAAEAETSEPEASQESKKQEPAAE